MDRFSAPQVKKKIKKELIPASSNETAPKKTSQTREAEDMNGAAAASNPNNKHYVSVGPETVTAIAESIGIATIGEDVASSLAEDVSYRLQEIINASCTLMRKSKRRKLLTSDVSSAFQISNVHHIFGHSQSEPFSFLRLPESELHIGDDQEVDLISLVSNNNIPKIKKPSYVTTSYPVLQSVEGLPVNGHAEVADGKSNTFPSHRLGAASSVNGDIKIEPSLSNSFDEAHHSSNKSLGKESIMSPDGKKRSSLSNGPHVKPALDSRSKLNGHVKFASYHGFREKLKRNSEEQYQLSKAQLLYFRVLSKCIIEGNNQLFKQALLSLHRNRKADSVCAPLLTFVALSVCHIPRHFGLLTRLLETVDVLLCNINTNPNHSIAVNRIVNALLAITADQNIIRGKNDFVLRRKAAHLLGKVLLTWGIEEEHVAELLSRVARVLGDAKEQIQSYYGALVIFQSLGKAALGWLHPLLRSFLPLLEKRFPTQSELSTKSVDPTSPSPLLEEIRSVLLDIVEVLFCDANSYRFKLKATTIQEVEATIQLDALLYHYCGDAVCARRRPSHLQTRKSDLNSTWTCLESKLKQPVFKYSDLRYISNYPQKQKQMGRHKHCDSEILKQICVAPIIRRKDIQFKFAGANPVPKDGLRKKVLDRSHVRFIPLPASNNQIQTNFPRTFQYLMVGRLHHNRIKTTKRFDLSCNLLNVL